MSLFNAVVLKVMISEFIQLINSCLQQLLLIMQLQHSNINSSYAMHACIMHACICMYTYIYTHRGYKNVPHYFSTITPAFLGDFLHFMYEYKQE